MSNHIAPGRKCSTCRFSKRSSLKATRKQMSQRLDGGDVAQVRAVTIQQERKDVHAALQHAASFHFLVEEWKDCVELGPKPKEKLFSYERKWKQRSIARGGVRQQTHIGV